MLVKLYKTLVGLQNIYQQLRTTKVLARINEPELDKKNNQEFTAVGLLQIFRHLNTHKQPKWVVGLVEYPSLVQTEPNDVPSLSK